MKKTPRPSAYAAWDEDNGWLCKGCGEPWSPDALWHDGRCTVMRRATGVEGVICREGAHFIPEPPMRRAEKQAAQRNGMAALLRSCGFKETYEGGFTWFVKPEERPVPAFLFLRDSDGQETRLGYVGNVTFENVAGQPMRMIFEVVKHEDDEEPEG